MDHSLGISNIADADLTQWLKSNLFTSPYNRIQCENILEGVKRSFSSRKLTVKQIGRCLRQAFVHIERKRSNSIYYYIGINWKSSLLPNTPNLTTKADETSDKSEQASFVPSILCISEEDIFISTSVLTNEICGPVFEGEFHCSKVAIKKVVPEKINIAVAEIDTLLKIGSHKFLPHVMGICMDVTSKPTHIIMQLYSSNDTLSNVLKEPWEIITCRNDWAKICIDLAYVVSFVNGKGFIHGNINPFSVLICKRWISSGEYIPKLTDFGNAISVLAIESHNNNSAELCEKAESSLTTGIRDHVAPEIKHGDDLSIKTDVYGLGYCLHKIINTAKLLHPSLKFWIAQSLKEKPKKRPPVSKLIERLELIYENGHFNDTVV